MTYKTIMVVDDAMIIRKKLVAEAINMGLEVVAEAKDGLEAVELYNKYLPDLVTMDITMPKMDGTEAVKLIMKNHPNATIIMATSHSDPRIVMESIMHGAKGYIVKPITSSKLQERIDQISGNSSNNETDDDLLDD